MSTELDRLLTREQRQECEKNAQLLRAAVDGRACRASGNHLVSAADEPEPFEVKAERQALETARLRQHTDEYHRRNDAQAVALQQQWLDAIRREGW